VNRDLAERLRTALTGGLHVETDPRQSYGCSIEAVMAHIAACQLRAIRGAMLMGDPDDGDLEEGRGWCTTGSFTRMDAIACIGATMALLQESQHLASEIRHALDEANATSSAERDLGVLRRAAAQKAEAAE
jgi:hypothetical protein